MGSDKSTSKGAADKSSKSKSSKSQDESIDYTYDELCASYNIVKKDWASSIAVYAKEHPQDPDQLLMSDEFWMAVAKTLHCQDIDKEFEALREAYQLQRETQGEDIYEVEYIVKHRGKVGAKSYFVKWKGYPDSDNSWVAEGDIFDESIIKEYEDKLAGKSKSKKPSTPKTPRSRRSSAGA
ncbi:hypothetical protein ADUPG1_010878, partial [Aduncisulcus paluster]